MKNLVIVESPAKAKTIEKYLGSDFHVMSSVGHIRTIAKKNKDGTPPIDVQHDFKTTYEVDSEKKKVIAELKKAVKQASQVWLATDEDREGEAIAWHLTQVLKLDPTTTKRIVFHEITKPAIEHAIQHPRTIDLNLVRAQQARQILDRLVGFELSPVVWRKVPGGKSAGRVQSPAVRLLVERENEIDNFQNKFDYRAVAHFNTTNGDDLKAELDHHLKDEPSVQQLLNSLKDLQFSVSSVEQTPGERKPGAPFTTSTLQQEANAKLGFSARTTMSSAQRLYQEGKITYMRTDSVILSGQALNDAQHYVSEHFGPEYSTVRHYKTKSANAQEAHEAIRPTSMAIEHAGSSSYDQRLYALIRNRTLASQMSNARVERTTLKISDSANSVIFESKGEVVTFKGFLAAYGDNKTDTTLPPLSVDDALKLESVTARQTFSRPPARYTEGSLVKKLEELGIGRPSTYATIINTLLTRAYAEKGQGEGQPRDVIEYTYDVTSHDVKRAVVQEKTGADRGKLVPTPIGDLISHFLLDHFDQIVNYGFTAQVEKQFDQIADGKLERNTMLHEFYTPFHRLIDAAGDIDRSSVSRAREIGIDPKTGKPILARLGRFGPMLQLGSTEDKSAKPKFAPMPQGKTLKTVTLDDALHAFELPRLVGQTEDGQDITASVGRFGPYIKIDKTFVSIKPLDPHSITLEQARAAYKDKLAKDAAKNIADFGNGLRVLNGRFGPYVTDGKKNAKIPKETDPQTITADQAKTILDKAPEHRRRVSRKRKNTTK